MPKQSNNSFTVQVTIEGTSPMLFHRWDCESVAEKANAKKGSKAKKEDDIESYIYRNADGDISIPGEYLRQAIIHAAKFKQDPRSPRKSAMDLFKAGILMRTELASLGKKEWDFIVSRKQCSDFVCRNHQFPDKLSAWKIFSGIFEHNFIIAKYC